MRVWGVSRINHILRVHGHTILEVQRAAEVYDEIGQPVFSKGSSEDRMTQATLSAELGSKERETSQLTHTREPSWQAKPRIRGMIRDAVWAGLLPEHFLETRLSRADL